MNRRDVRGSILSFLLGLSPAIACIVMWLTWDEIPTLGSVALAAAMLVAIWGLNRLARERPRGL